jgi:hypothetical protein
MRAARTGAALLVAAVAVASSAAADPYGEPPPERDGFLVGVGVGPSIFKGAGDEMSDLQGIGGDLNIRVGTSAGESLLWLLELQTGGYLVELTTEAGTGTTYNALGAVTLGGQIYVREALWLRGGAGLAGFTEHEGRSGPEVPGSRRAGLGLLGGGGYDVFRRRNVAISLEAASTLGLFRRGILGRTAFLMAITFY